MKKLLLTLAVLILLPISINAEGLTGCAFGTVQTFDDFKHIDLGGRIGFITSLDSDKDMSLRIVATQIDIGDENMTTIQPVVMWKWFLGKKWDIWWVVGSEIYVDGPNEGMDGIVGIGASRSLATINKDWPTPAILSGFFEASFTEAGMTATGSYAQINLGVIFSPGSSK